MPSLFQHITQGKLHWEDMGEVYDKIVFEDKTYDLVKGRKNLVAPRLFEHWKSRTPLAAINKSE